MFMDIRSLKTRQQIAQCFEQMLAEKHISKITVTDLCEHANINRATFYKHFLDIYDLQEMLEQEVLSELELFLRERAFSDNGNYQAMLVELLYYAKQFGTRFYILCSVNAASDLPSKVFQLLYSLAFPILKKNLPDMDADRAKLLYKYVSHGCGSVLRSWLNGESTMTESEAAEFIMMTSGATVAAIADSRRS